MLKALFKFLRGDSPAVQSMPVVFIRNWNQLELNDERCHIRSREILGIMGTTVVESDFYITDYHDINTKPFPDEIKEIAQAYRYSTNGHAIILHSGDDGDLWRVNKRLVTLLLDCYGFTTVTSIGYTTVHKRGNAYVYKREGGKPKEIGHFNDLQFDENRRFILTGKRD